MEVFEKERRERMEWGLSTNKGKRKQPCSIIGKINVD
jgi:hypothetical protein